MMQARFDRRQFLAALVAGGGLAAAACSGPMTRSAAALAARQPWPQADAFLRAYLAETPLPGAAGAIGLAGEAPDFLLHGTAYEGGPPVGPDTLWRVYSMTKPITGMAAMILVEEGRLALDQEIAELLPEWSEPRVLLDPDNSLEARPATGAITVRQLLTHTAGLGYTIVTTGPLLEEYRRLGLVPALLSIAADEEVARPPSLAEFSERLATLPLIADPGAVWSYSMSLDLLGRVIEVASGMPFDAFLRRRIFDPLGMASTFFEVPDSAADRMTANYMIGPAGRARVVDPAQGSVFLETPAFPFGGAGLVASARDYDRFLAMLLGEGTVDGVRVMAPETARLAMSDLLPAGVDKSRMFVPSGFGAGGRVVTAPGPAGEGVGTFGWGGAAGTTAWVDRANGFRASGYIQQFGPSNRGFGEGFSRAVYADLAAAGG